jgi:hypothetical protein
MKNVLVTLLSESTQNYIEAKNLKNPNKHHNNVHEPCSAPTPTFFVRMHIND